MRVAGNFFIRDSQIIKASGIFFLNCQKCHCFIFCSRLSYCIISDGQNKREKHKKVIEQKINLKTHKYNVIGS